MRLVAHQGQAHEGHIGFGDGIDGQISEPQSAGLVELRLEADHIDPPELAVHACGGFFERYSRIVCHSVGEIVNIGRAGEIAGLPDRIHPPLGEVGLVFIPSGSV
jgi:hypothetical protein